MWVKDESLSPLAMLQVHKHKDNDTDNVVTEFACLKGRRLALIFGNPLSGRHCLPFFRRYHCTLPTAVEIDTVISFIFIYWKCEKAKKGISKILIYKNFLGEPGGESMPPDSPSNFFPVRTLSHAWRVVFMYAHTPLRDKDSPTSLYRHLSITDSFL